MPKIVTLTGVRYTDRTEGRVSLVPRIPWYVVSGAQTVAPGPLYFKITSAGGLTTLSGNPAQVVPTYDTSSGMTFTPEGAAYIARINIAGQEIIESWTVDGATSTINWATLGVKAAPSDRITYPVPLTTNSPLAHYDNPAALPSGVHPGVIVYIVSGGTSHWYGWTPSEQWRSIT